MFEALELLGYLEDNTYFCLLNKPIQVETRKAICMSDSQLMGRWLGYVMAYICKCMEVELREAQLCMDFPHNQRVANAIFKTEDIGEVEIIYLPKKIYSWSKNRCIDFPLSLEKIYGRMSEAERNSLKELEAKGSFVDKISDYEMSQVVQGIFEGTVIFVNHLSLSTLSENVDIFPVAEQEAKHILPVLYGGRTIRKKKVRMVLDLRLNYVRHSWKIDNENTNEKAEPKNSDDETINETTEPKTFSFEDIRSALLNWNWSIEKMKRHLTKYGQIDEVVAQYRIDEVCYDIKNERKKKCLPFLIAAGMLFLLGILLITLDSPIGLFLCIISPFCLWKCYTIFKKYRIERETL